MWVSRHRYTRGQYYTSESLYMIVKFVCTHGHHMIVHIFQLDLDPDSGRAMSEWSLGFGVADNGVFVGEETMVVRRRRNHKVFHHSKSEHDPLFALFS
ncbi:hypothetical protein Bca101_066751 [Brassica carinata]